MRQWRVSVVQGSLVERLQKTEEGRLRRFFMRRLRNREDALDATQETFLRLLSTTPRREIENPYAYLFQVARSVAHGVIARLLREGQLFLTLPQETEWADEAPDAERIVAGRQQLLLLIRTIEALPERCKMAFVLSRVEGLSNGEIAGRMGISRNMVEKHIIKALLHCHRAWQDGTGEGRP